MNYLISLSCNFQGLSITFRQALNIFLTQPTNSAAVIIFINLVSQSITGYLVKNTFDMDL